MPALSMWYLPYLTLPYLSPYIFCKPENINTHDQNAVAELHNDFVISRIEG